MTEQTLESTTVTFILDGKSITVPKGTTVYAAAKAEGIDIPIFCYHDRMPPFGACRVCLVEVEKMGKLQASCTLEAAEGMVVKTQSQLAKEGRESILELLLINHPLDCPICDRGGECPLQDQTMKFGPETSRFYEEKRHFEKPYPLGPVLMLDRERCIVCARCTRFSDLISGDHALEFLDRGYRTEVGTPDGQAPKSKFIGNTIKICPVGALTSQVYRFRARPWDNLPTQSTCTLCPVGCSLYLDSRDGEIMRTRSYENHEVNDIWLCDKGWFGYEFISSPDRLQQPLIKKEGVFQEASWDEAFNLIASKIVEFQGKKIAGFGGDNLTVEENYLFQKLIREGAKTNNVDHRVGCPTFSLRDEGLPPGMDMSIAEIENTQTFYLLGLDLTEEFPVIWLRLRAAINKGAKVIFIGHFAPEIAPYLTQTIVHPPGKEIETLKRHLAPGKAAIFVGSQYLHSVDRRVILDEITKMKEASINLMEGRGNSMGARFAGMHPEIGPHGQRISYPGLSAPKVIEEAAQKGWDLLIVAGANPAIKYPKKVWDAVRSKLKFLVVQDLFMTETAAQADVVLPTLAYVEKTGTFLNIEGRAQKLQIGKNIPENIYADREIFYHLGTRLKLSMKIEAHFINLLQNGRIKLETSQQDKHHPKEKIQGLTASFARALFDDGVRMQHNSHLKQLVKQPHARLHPMEGIQRKIADGDLVRLTIGNNSIAGKIAFDSTVAKGTIVLPLGFRELPAHELGIELFNGMHIDIARENS